VDTVEQVDPTARRALCAAVDAGQHAERSGHHAARGPDRDRTVATAPATTHWFTGRCRPVQL